MNLTHRFSVPASIDEAWAAFSRLDQIAPCFPGAVVDSVEDGDYRGFVKIKFGPLPLVYNGIARYTELNEEARRMVIEARAADRRGTSRAAATVTATFTETGNITDVQVLTELAITGRPAQFGHGVITDVSDKLLDLFLNCVTDKFDRGDFVAPAPQTRTEVTAEPGGEHGRELGAEPVAEATSELAAEQPSSTGPQPRTNAAPYVYTPPSDSGQPDFNVFATVVPVLVKRGWPFLLGGAVLGVIVRGIVRAARRR